MFILHAARIPKIMTAATSPMQRIQHSLFLFDLVRLSWVTYSFSPLQSEITKKVQQRHLCCTYYNQEQHNVLMRGKKSDRSGDRPITICKHRRRMIKRGVFSTSTCWVNESAGTGMLCEKIFTGSRWVGASKLCVFHRSM